MPVCIRFVGKQKNIGEEFLEFGICKQVTGEAIAEEIIRVLGKIGLNIEHCRGQSYDGASNMSSEAVGIQGRITRLCEKAFYSHCCGHSLSLVIVSACNIPIVRNTLDIVKETSKMFVLGLKKMNFLKEVVQQNQHFTPNQKVVFNVCVTRWVDTLMVTTCFCWLILI